MSYDRVLTHGLGTAGGFLWDTIKDKFPDHNSVLGEMRERQKLLASYSKGRDMDDIQVELLRDIRFLETIAWRMYMYGVKKTVLTALKPNRTGEFFKRKRNDPTYWKMRALAGEKKADKWLKRVMREEWEKAILSRYNY